MVGRWGRKSKRKGGAGADEAKAKSAGSSDALNDSVDAAVERFVDLVAVVKSRTTGPLLKAARGLVYGLVIAVAAVAVLVLAAVALVRVIDIAVPGDVWSAHLITAGVFGLLGALAWSRRRPAAEKS